MREAALLATSQDPGNAEHGQREKCQPQPHVRALLVPVKVRSWLEALEHAVLEGRVTGDANVAPSHPQMKRWAIIVPPLGLQSPRLARTAKKAIRERTEPPKPNGCTRFHSRAWSPDVQVPPVHACGRTNAQAQRRRQMPLPRHEDRPFAQVHRRSFDPRGAFCENV